MGSSCSRDNSLTETNTKTQGGQKDGSVEVDRQVSVAVREISVTTEKTAGSL